MIEFFDGKTCCSSCMNFLFNFRRDDNSSKNEGENFQTAGCRDQGDEGAGVDDQFFFNRHFAYLRSGRLH